MKPYLMATAITFAGLTAATAQTLTPGIGGVAVTGRSGAGVFIPYGGGSPTIGAPGVGSYTLNGGGYTSPYSWSNYSNPTAYNFNTGGFNYNSGLYQSGYVGTPWVGGSNVIQAGSYYRSGNAFYPSGSTYYRPSSGYYTPSRGLRSTVYPYNRGMGRWRR